MRLYSNVMKEMIKTAQVKNSDDNLINYWKEEDNSARVFRISIQGNFWAHTVWEHADGYNASIKEMQHLIKLRRTESLLIY